MDYLLDLITRYPVLRETRGQIQNAYTVLIRAFSAGKKLLIAGNGGSAADAEHITGELMKGFLRPRPPGAAFLRALRALKNESAFEDAPFEYLSEKLQEALPAISLVTNNAIGSACVNDIDGAIGYAQQVYALGAAGDVFLGISTSGNAKNVLYAALTARARGMDVLALSGGSGGNLAKLAGANAIIVPEHETYKIQELHLPVYHTLCLMIEEHFFTEPRCG
jgi:D-sedoheptulose 7-phosphate isomerase